MTSKQRRVKERCTVDSSTPSMWSPTPCLWPGYRRNGALWDVIMVSWVWRAKGVSLPLALFFFLRPISTERVFMRNQVFCVFFQSRFLVCACLRMCVAEGGDGAPHGGEGRTIERGALSDPERSASRRQGQGYPHLPEVTPPRPHVEKKA